MITLEQVCSDDPARGLSRRQPRRLFGHVGYLGSLLPGVPDILLCQGQSGLIFEAQQTAVVGILLDFTISS